MPKVSKVTPGFNSRGTRLPEPVTNERTEFYCCRCGKKYKRQKGNFTPVQSSIYSGNNGYLTTCNHCITELYKHYFIALGSADRAIRRICNKFDVYWNPAACKVALRGSKMPDKYALTYIAHTNTLPFMGRTYDDTLDEEESRVPTMIVTEIDEDGNEKAVTAEQVVPEDVRNFWRGFPEQDCLALQSIYDGWTAVEDPNTSFTREQLRIIKQISILEWRISKGAQNGAKISDDVSQYNSLINSANLSPSKKKADERAADDVLTFGTGIKRWEDDKPIPDPDPDFADVDKIARYMSIWFLGHLCHTLNIKNSYSKLYEDEMAKRRVERPEYSGEDDESFFDSVFASDEGDDDD